MLTPFHKMRGMTLIEVMVAIVIFGILMALGSGSFMAWMQNQQTRTAAESILNGLQVARGEAVLRNASVIFVMCDLSQGNKGSSWDVLAASAPAMATACGADAASSTGWTRVQTRTALEGSANAQASASAVGANAVAFNGLGRVTTLSPIGAVPLPPAVNAITQGLTVVNVNNPKGDRPAGLNVTISAAGSVRLCDPATTLSPNDPRHC